MMTVTKARLEVKMMMPIATLIQRVEKGSVVPLCVRLLHGVLTPEWMKKARMYPMKNATRTAALEDVAKLLTMMMLRLRVSYHFIYLPVISSFLRH